MKHLAECESIAFVDLSHNDIEYDERVLDVFISMLRINCISLKANPISKA
jgi:hypothetical protein